MISEVTGTNFVQLVMVSDSPFGYALLVFVLNARCCSILIACCLRFLALPQLALPVVFSSHVSRFYLFVFCLFHFFLTPHSLYDPFVGQVNLDLFSFNYNRKWYLIILFSIVKIKCYEKHWESYDCFLM